MYGHFDGVGMLYEENEDEEKCPTSSLHEQALFDREFLVAHYAF